VLTDVVAGPSYALRRIDDRPPSTGDGRLDDAKAGILVDPARQVLLFFGSHRQALQLDLRAALFAVLRHTWPGWTVRWAYGGVADLLAYVGLTDRSAFDDADPADAAHLTWLRGLAPAVGPATIEGVTAEARHEAPAVPTAAQRRATFDTLHAVATSAV
jgi:hypothetical protein